MSERNDRYSGVSFGKKITVTSLLSLASIIGFILFLIGVFEEDLTTKELVYSIALVVLAFASFIMFIWQEYRYARKARYAEATSQIHGALHHLRDAWYCWKNDGSKLDIDNYIKLSLTALKGVFTLITGTNCRICIKVIYVPDDDKDKREVGERELAVFTYMRSGSGSDDGDQVHWVSDNSDFQDILRNHGTARKHFFANVLPYNGYKNSKYNVGVNPNIMDYRSTVVCPIRKYPYEQGSRPLQKQDLIGYLCVDSKAKKVFVRRFDVDLGLAFADALYIVLRSCLDEGSKDVSPT